MVSIKYGSLRIIGNDVLNSLDGLENLNNLGDTLSIINNPLLTDFCALKNLLTDFIEATPPLNL